MLLLAVNTVAWCTPLFALSLVKLALPLRAVRVRIDPWLNAIATGWVSCNGTWMRLTQRTVWDVAGIDDICADDCYLVNANHQSWADVFVLQHVLNRRIPALKFFLKRQLIFVPVIGIAWWALDFPFMRRHSKAALAKRPELRQQDRETTRRACEKFALVPTCVMNFAEGTRFTEQKHLQQRSPYRHLLKPRAGALAMSLGAMGAMGAKFSSLIDVTIVYPDGAPTFWQFACGRTPRIVVRAQRQRIPAEFSVGDYAGDASFRATFNAWMTKQWEEKDRQIDVLLAGPGAAPAD
jgi:1-acyl-sn-glycerol-3-phosphate acyltransferase